MTKNILDKVLIFGLVTIAVHHTVHCMSFADINEEMQSDDYDYYTADEAGFSNQQKPQVNPPKSIPVKSNRNISKTVTGSLNKDIVLSCEEKIFKDNVILWYHGNNLISNGNNVVLPNFSIDPNSFNLTIIRASPQSEGDYFCEILPQKVRILTKVIVTEHYPEAITSQSTTSGQSNFGPSISVLSSLLITGLCLYLK